MIDDLRNVVWKEWKGLFRWRGSRARAVSTLLLPLGIFAVFVPWDSGEHWRSGLPSVIASIALPILVVFLIVPDSFAGERERHTLPTLLASRLPDRAILFGKVGFAVALAWGAALFTLSLGLITYNVVYWSGRPVFYSPKVAAVDLALSLTFAGLAASLGAVISLRSATVQEAQQTLVSALFVPPMLLGPILLLISKARPEWRPKILLGDLASPSLLVILVTVLLALDALLLAVAMARFRRERLF